uniref:Uncharacterized protein n=1 Tax=viral metagenome TaxID=1070528 RepID=A0A6M3KDX7_9ZZZZ
MKQDSSLLTIIDEILEEELEILEEVMKEEVQPLVQYQKNLETKIANAAITEMYKAEQEAM